MTSYKSYDEYKQSKVDWIGKVPIKWETRRIKEIASLTTGMTPPTADEENYSEESDYPWVRPEDLTDPPLVVTASKFLSTIGWSLSRKVLSNSTLICGIGTIGKVGFTTKTITTNQQITAAQFKKNQKFFFYTIIAARKELELSAMGNVVKILNNERLGNVALPVCPDEEAIKIADFLDFKTAQIDALIAKKEALLLKLQEKRSALITQAVTKGINPNVLMKPSGVEWLGDVPAHWDVKRMRFALTTNPSKSELDLKENDLVSFIPMEAVGEYGGLVLETEKEVSEIGSGYTYFKDEDVVVAKITPCFENGKGAIAKGLKNKTAFGTTELHVLRASVGLNPDFLFQLTISYPFRKIGESEMYGAGGQKRVPETFIKDFKIGFPPLAEQLQIVEYIKQKNDYFERQFKAVSYAITRLTEYRSALITNAVTGKIDVRDFDLNKTIA